jgi:hypothetical protein
MSDQIEFKPPEVQLNIPLLTSVPVLIAAALNAELSLIQQYGEKVQQATEKLKAEIKADLEKQAAYAQCRVADTLNSKMKLNFVHAGTETRWTDLEKTGFAELGGAQQLKKTTIGDRYGTGSSTAYSSGNGSGLRGSEKTDCRGRGFCGTGKGSLHVSVRRAGRCPGHFRSGADGSRI